MSKLAATALGALAALCTYWSIASGQAAADHQPWTWLGLPLTPAQADSAQTAFLVAVVGLGIGSVIAALSARADAKRATN